MLRKVGGSSANSAAVREKSPQVQIDQAARLAMLDAFEENEIGWFWATDAENRLTYLSNSAAKKFGDGKQVVGQSLAELIETFDESSDKEGERPLSFFLGSRTRFRDLVVRLRGEDDAQWWSITGRPHYDEAERFIGFRGSAKDISSEFVRQRSESQLAQYDTLTSLANRHRMEKRLDSILASYRVAKRSCALLMMDLDKFKKVNDTLGHPAGDELLRQVAQRLQRIVVAPAEIGRLGGDEFQIIVPDVDDRGKLGELCKKIIQMVSQPYSLNGDRATIGASIGIAIAPYDGLNRQELVKSADLALYASKAGGRGQYRFYSSDLANDARRQREIGEELADAIVNDELTMHYQPIVRSTDHKVIAFEALMRWDHPELGAIGPGTFITVAEEINLISRISEWSLRRACTDAMQWPGDIRVSVNISAQQFFAGGLPSLVATILDETGLRANRLELEITEGVFMGESSMVDAIFAKLTKMGVRLSLDDFGTGYSSLAYLRRAPFEKIKIDQNFVRGCCEEGNPNAAIITAIISLAHALDMQTTAEGVEAMDELRLLLGLGATQIQGFIFSRPVCQDVVMEKLASGDFIYEPVGPAKHRSDRRTLYRRIGVIHEDHRYDAVLRNLSRTGAMIEGLLDVPIGTDLVLDLGGGQLAVAMVRRSQDATQGVQFETPLISDGANGLCTRHRVSPYQLAAAGMPLASLSADSTAPVSPAPARARRFMQVDVSSASSRAA
ncbi:hypothetical protein GCM10009127_17570 [Alteraurantiacibacter aestuarii]